MGYLENEVKYWKDKYELLSDDFDSLRMISHKQWELVEELRREREAYKKFFETIGELLEITKKFK